MITENPGRSKFGLVCDPISQSTGRLVLAQVGQVDSEAVR
jgi:hypothetical protein